MVGDVIREILPDEAPIRVEDHTDYRDHSRVLELDRTRSVRDVVFR